MGRFTGIDDVNELVRIVRDPSEDDDKRTMAIVDLSMVEDFDVHQFLDFVADKNQADQLRGEMLDQFGFQWDERILPILLDAFQESSIEIRFWAAYGIEAAHRHWHHTDIDCLIALLDQVAASKEVLSGWWHVGREALLPLETAYRRKLMGSDNREPETEVVRFHLISPMPEYWTYSMRIRQGELLPSESPLQIDPVWLQEQIKQRWPQAKVNTRQPRPRASLLDWQIGRGKIPLMGALHRDGYGVVITGNDGWIARFALWYRSIIDEKIPLYIYEWADAAKELKPNMTVEAFWKSIQDLDKNDPFE